MTTIPKELQVLLDGYRDILTQLDNGTIDFGSAKQMLGELRAEAVDGSVWGVSSEYDPADEVFLRTPPGGGPAAIAPPNMFSAAPTSAPSAGANTQSPVNQTRLDDLLTPPSVNESGYTDDPWGQQYSSTSGYSNDGFPNGLADTNPWDGPNQGFPGDVIVGEPTGTPWSPQSPSQHNTPGMSPPGQPPGQQQGHPQYGVHVQAPKHTRRSGVSKATANITSKISGITGNMSAGTKKTAAIAVACVIVLVVFLLTRTDKPAAPGKSAAQITCPAATAKVTGVTGEQAKLLGCLDAPWGPEIATIAVSPDGNGGAVFEGTRHLTRAQSIHTVMRLYSNAGGPSARTSTPVDVTGLAADVGASVQGAVDLGIVTDATNLNAPVTRGEFAVLLYRALMRAGVIKDAPGGTKPSDAPQGDPEAAQAVVALRKAGLMDGKPEDPFMYGDPLVVNDWVIWAGRSTYEIHKPGSFTSGAASGAGSTAPAPQDTTTAADVAVPTERVTTAISALVSGDVGIVSGVVTETGDATQLVEQTAMWAGFAPMGLTVTPGAQAADGNNVVQGIEVSDGNTKLTYNVTWVNSDGTWLMKSWPTLRN